MATYSFFIENWLNRIKTKSEENFSKFNTHVAVARKATLPVQNGTNLKVDFFECLDPPRYQKDKNIGFHRCP